MADPVERLTNLVALLLEARQPLTREQIAHELAGQYPASEHGLRAAFERDKAVLRAEGVPIESTVLSGDRAGASAYWIDRQLYALPDLGLTDDEKQALQVAVAMAHLGGAAGDDALLKLGAPDPAVEAAVVTALPSPPVLPALHAAVQARATVSFRYRGEARRLDPYGLLARDGFWYVVGRDHRSGEQRTFRADRIEGEVAVDDPGGFVVPAGFDPASAVPDDPRVLGGGEVVEARVLVARSRARQVVAELGEDAVEERRPDGAVVVRVPFTNGPALRSWVLGLLDHAEVLDPPEVRDDVVAWLTRLAGTP